ncbi:F-box only protein 16 isoform X1 [Electrophorus electricus]|uniref:F-box domain-containing protein n=1 Tax=Electrophorus electricus TaxID=8005 RepID=A0A4W4ELA5_ELEEL|nr:F-box only protein 16 isoform X1 [Electrophorus electricus]XP_035380397.1 F-box only protein 16 isoform X1 [Electrophorus electricus]
MALALRETPGTRMQSKRSAWTPLNHGPSNSRMFEERRNLLGKWFDKWTDSQRKQVLQDCLARCSVGQLKHLRQTLCRLVSEEALDFTVVLPRVLALYIFSFLDPRSLCRCAQVSWRWKSLVELEQLWMPKCLRLGWCISFAPTPFEQGVWKRHYVETVQGLHVGRPKAPACEEFLVPEVKVIGSEMQEMTAEIGYQEPKSGPLRGRSSVGRGVTTSAKGLPPWRDSARHPTDTIRFNYLENLDPVEHARQGQACLKKSVSASSYKLRQAKSLMLLDPGADGKRRQGRPQWAARSLAPFSAGQGLEKRLGSSQWNAGIRPSPVTAPVPRLSKAGLRALLRSQRSTPTAALVEEQPWRRTATDEA